MPSGVHSTLPPAVGYITRGITSGNRLPLATSYTYAVPSSLPFSDSDTITCLPSNDGL